MTKLFHSNTLKGRLIRFFMAFLGIMGLLFGMVLLYNWKVNRIYERTISTMGLVNQYYEQLDAALLAQRGYIYYEGEEDLQEAEVAYQLMWDTIRKLKEEPMKKECYFAVRNLEEMTLSLRERIEAIYDAMDRYHKGESDNLDEVNACNRETLDIYAAIYEEYNDVNQKMLDYGKEVYDNMQQQRQIAYLFFSLILIAAGGFLYEQLRMIHNSVILPTQELIRAAQRVKEGDFQQEIVPDQNIDQDMKLLAEVFQTMVQKLKLQIDTLEENIKIQKELQESRFKELQMQINPHFMFNTLNMLTETAYLEQAEQTASLLKLTAKMFRYSLDFSGRHVTLYREMEELGNYVSIQEQRYGERIRFEFDLDERFHNIRVPALSLQPLVENAVVHGCGMKISGARICIVTKYEEEEKCAEISVEDNGIGMDETEVSQVLEEIAGYNTENSVKVGLGNVYMRFKLLFGERMEMKLYSEKGKGTKVCFLLKNVEVKEHVSDSDCR